MSQEELFCPQHGPYSASLGSCPYCSHQDSGLPGAPRPLDEDDLPTEASGPEPARAPGGYGDNQTLPPSRGGGGLYGDSDETILPERRRLLDDYDELDRTVIDKPETGLIGWLIVKSSPYMRRGQIKKIRPGAIWGRDPKKADEIINDDKVSSLHARIQVKEEQFLLIDLGSSNGTWVNGEEISGQTVINQDDEIKMGNTVFVLKTL